MIRSITPDRTGMPVMSAGGSITDHRSPLKERWGGWYVTGTTGEQTHMGNAVLRNPAEDDRLPISEGTGNVTDLRHFVDTGAYLARDSDLVALMTLEHETQMQNLITRAGWDARIAMHENRAINNAAVEELLDYMLFRDEAKLSEKVKGTSDFAEYFQKMGPFDATGRSLRQFDLKTRMFRYPCSFLIYSEAFDAMPAVVLERVYKRLWEVLTGQDARPRFAHLSAEDRRNIIGIILATKKGLPAYWRS
jgi:hypothetical protein